VLPEYENATVSCRVQSRIAGYLDAFARSLPRQIDAPAISRVKLAGNTVWCREALLWRFTELGQDALEKLDQKRWHRRCC